MNRKWKRSSTPTVYSSTTQVFTLMIDYAFECVYIYVELPLQSACYHFGKMFSYKPRQRTFFQLTKNLTDILVQSYIISFILYFLILFFAPLFSLAIQRCYFLDPLLSVDRQCINIQFVRIKPFDSNHTRLKQNFLGENLVIGNEYPRKDDYNYLQLKQLLDLLDNCHYIICQRSLYLYARFQIYAQILHSNHSQYRFVLPKYPRSFALDQPPFLDLCVHTMNRSHSEQIQSRLRSLSSSWYSSINLFVFNWNFTQVTVTLYELNQKSTHLERISIHTGWLRDVYAQLDYFKYEDALSTVLFDGFAREQQSVDYFDHFHIPVPADALLGLNEMAQRALLVLPLCRPMAGQQL